MYTKKMAQENRNLFSRARTLLEKVGWSPYTEEINNFGRLAPSVLECRQKVVSQIQVEYPHINPKRIMHQTNRVMMQARAKGEL